MTCDDVEKAAEEWGNDERKWDKEQDSGAQIWTDKEMIRFAIAMINRVREEDAIIADGEHIIQVDSSGKIGPLTPGMAIRALKIEEK